MTELEYLEELHRKATVGPWSQEGPDMFGDYNILHPADSLAVGAVVSNLRYPTEVRANADIVPATRNALPDFIAAVRALVKARELLEPFADPGCSLGLGENVIPNIDAALAPFMKEHG